MLFGPTDKLVRFAYTDVLIDNKEAGSFKPCNGYPLMRLLIELIETLKPLWKEVGDDPSRRDEKGRPIRFSLYPQTALIEAAVNLVIHRDYEVNDHAHVIIDEDRIEFVNPGTSPYDEAELLAEKVFRPKYDRNPHLINVVARTELNQRQGGGIARIIGALRENGNIFPNGRPALEIVNDKEQNRFKLVIYRRGEHRSDKVSSLHVPLQRPPRVEHFTGREKELNQLIADLQPGQIVTLTGPGGIGKSALASEAVWSLPPDRFPDGIIFHSFHNQPQAALALENIALAFGEDPKPTAKDGAQRALAGKQALLLLDGAEEADNLAIVLSMAGGCGVLVTSRKRQDATAQRQDIEPLERDEAIELLQAWGKEQASDKIAAGRISELVGGLPLAVRLVGRYLDQTGEAAKEYLVWLETTPIQALAQGEHKGDSVLVLLERSLKQVSQEAKEVLGVVGRLALAGFGVEPIAVALGLEERATRNLLGELVSYGLLLRSEMGYEVSHVLVHTYADKRVAVADEVMGRLVGYYTELAKAESKKGPEGYRRLDTERGIY